jgi:hypothetical protein
VAAVRYINIVLVVSVQQLVLRVLTGDEDATTDRIQDEIAIGCLVMSFWQACTMDAVDKLGLSQMNWVLTCHAGRSTVVLDWQHCQHLYKRGN